MNIILLIFVPLLGILFLLCCWLISALEKSGERNEELFEENEGLKEDIGRAYTFARQASRDYTAIAEKVGILLGQEWERVPPVNFEVLDLLDAKIAQKQEKGRG